MKMETNMTQKTDEKDHNFEADTSSSSTNLEEVLINESNFQWVVDSGMEIGGGNGVFCD